MAKKYDARDVYEPDAHQTRQTRSSRASTKLPYNADHADSPPPRKRRRALQNEDEIENSHDPEILARKRAPNRRVGKFTDVQPEGRMDEDSLADEAKLASNKSRRCNPSNTLKSGRRRVVLESVEIMTERRVEPSARSDKSIPVIPQSPGATQRSRTSTAAASLLKDSSSSLPFSTKKIAPSILEELPKRLPERLHSCLEEQKRVVLNAFRDPPYLDHAVAKNGGTFDDDPLNAMTLRQVGELLGGTIERGEGNSCLVIGPAGSGKTKVVEKALEQYVEEHRPIVIRLNGHVQQTDRLAIHEIARQVHDQTGSKVFESLSTEDDENPFNVGEPDELLVNLPPPSHLPSVITALPSLPRPVVVILDAFNIFTEQPRQALLYCLLDTVQSCRAGSASNRGLAVIGLTSRIDVVNFLEKRVKSRFSHRIFRTAHMRRQGEWITFLNRCMRTSISGPTASLVLEWRNIWERNLDLFFQDRSVRDTLNDIFGVSRDIRSLLRTMTEAIVNVSPSSPYLSSHVLQRCTQSQRGRAQSAVLTRLNYPSLSLCVAAQHSCTAGHDSFTFEMLHELFSNQVRTSSAAPVMLGGGSIGMVNIGRRVLASAFEDLVHMKIFVQAAPASIGLGKEFIKYRMTIDRADVKAAVERAGQTSLKKWFSIAQ